MPYPINTAHRLLLENGSLILLESASFMVLDEQLGLDDPLDAATTTITPGLSFTGEEVRYGSPLHYEVQVDTANTFDSVSNPLTPAFVQSKHNSGTTINTLGITFNANVTSGNTIVLAFTLADDTTTVSSIVDSFSNTYHAVSNYGDATNNFHGFLYYAYNVTGGALTLTVNTSGNVGITMVAQEFSNVTTTDPKDQTSTVWSNGTGSSVSIAATGSTTQAKEMVIAVGAADSAVSSFSAAGTGYSNFDSATATATNTAMESKLVTSTGTQTAGITLTGGADWAGAIITLKGGSFGTPMLDSLSDTNTGFTDDITAKADDKLLLETGSSLLLESGSKVVINYSYPQSDELTYAVASGVLTSGLTYYWRARHYYYAPTGYTAVTQQFDASGTFIPPVGVTLVTASAWGGGGQGGPDGGSGGGGGGGGGFSEGNVTVTPGTAYTVNIGAGSTGSGGGDTYFKDTSTVLAKGGSDGTGAVGGAGGAAASGVGAIKTSGGTGGGINAGTGGGGGGSAGQAGDGGNGSNGTGITGGNGGTAGLGNPAGAVGGKSGGVGAASTAGTVPGGAGGGSSGSGAVGVGAAGRVTITWYVPYYTKTFSSWSGIRNFLVGTGGTVYTSALTGTLSFAGVFSKTPRKNLTAGLSFTGSFTRFTRRSLIAGISFTGSLVKRTGRTLTAGLSFVGTFIAGVLHILLLSGSLSFTGNFSKRPGKNLTASLSFTGVMAKFTRRSLTAGVSFTGTIAKRLTRAFTGGLSFTAALTKTAKKVMTGSLSFTGTIAKRVGKKLTATLSFTGVFKKRVAKSLSAGLSFTGAIKRLISKQFSGSFSFTGLLGVAKTIIPSVIGTVVGVLQSAFRVGTASSPTDIASIDVSANIKTVQSDTNTETIESDKNDTNLTTGSSSGTI